LGIVRSRDVTVLRHWRRWTDDDDVTDDVIATAQQQQQRRRWRGRGEEDDGSPRAVVHGSVVHQFMTTRF